MKGCVVAPLGKSYHVYRQVGRRSANRLIHCYCCCVDERERER